MLIGVVGMQLAAGPHAFVARLLPFYGPQEVIASSLTASGPVLGPLLLTVA